MNGSGKIYFILVYFISVFWRCWSDGRKGIRPVKTEWWGAGVVICLEWGAYLHVAQLMPLPLTVSCFSKIQIGFTFLVLAHPGSSGKRAIKLVCVCVCVCILFQSFTQSTWRRPHSSIQCLIMHDVTIVHWVAGAWLAAAALPSENWWAAMQWSCCLCESFCFLMGVSGWMLLLVPAHLCSPQTKGC